MDMPGSDAGDEPLRLEIARLRGALAALRAQHETQIVELRHRTFNHLQIIVSLIRLRMRRVQSSETRQQLSALESYVIALSLLQRHLDTEDAETDFGAYLKEQAALWQPLLTERDIAIVVSAEGATVPAAKAVPLALIVNELVTNACKHAFPEGRRGTIRIAVHAREPPWLELVVADDGIGILDDVRPGAVGRTLTTVLAAQIGAEVSKDTMASGTAVRLRFAAA